MPINGKLIVNLDGKYFEHQITQNNNELMCEADCVQLCRTELIKTLQKSLFDKDQTKLFAFKNELRQKFDTNKYIYDLVNDIQSSDDNQGQLGKALEKIDWFEKWGKHYLKSIIRAHELEKCINFKDLSIQHYSSPEFLAEQKRMETIFIGLTPPQPSGYMAGANTNVTPVAMTSYYRQSGGCFDGNSRVKMADLTTKFVKDIKKNDIVYSSLGNNNCANVVAVLKLKVDKLISMNTLEGMYVTPYHPVNFNGKWVFPVDLQTPESIYIDYMYDFVLDNGHTVNINRIDVITLGHGYTFNKVVSHKYFGNLIVNDLMKHSKWETGLIQLDDYIFIRDEDSSVVKLVFTDLSN